MDLTGVFNNITDDYILIASFLVTALAAYLGIKFALGLLNRESSSNISYSSGHLNDSGYMGWLSTKDGASNSIDNKYDRYDEPYQNYLNRDR